MLQSQTDLDPLFLQADHFIQIVIDRLLIPYSFFRFDPRPFNGKTVCLMPQFGNQFDILPIEFISVACKTRSCGFRALHLPVVMTRMDIPAFDLMTGRGTSPQKILRKLKIIQRKNIIHGEKTSSLILA